MSGQLHKYWSGLLKEGDILYMPRGVIHYGKTQPAKANESEHQHSLHITVSNQQHNSWADFLQAGIAKTLKQMTKHSYELRAALPTDIFSNQQATKEAYRELLKKVFDEIQSDAACQQTIWKWQTRFMHRRQAPQEILQPNSAEDAGLLDDVPMAEEGSQSDDQSDQSSQSDQSGEVKENPEDDEQNEEADFTKVKLSSKHAAFLRQDSDKKWFLCYATQN